MNIPEIEVIRQKLFDVYHATENVCRTETTDRLTELEHRASDLKRDQGWTTRTAADILNCACRQILETRLR